MPIKRISNRRMSYPMIGVLRKGAKKPTDTKPGADLTYFRFVSDDDEANRLFAEAYGPEPRRINVMLPFSSVDENLDAWMEHWVAGGLKHRCDGETAVLWQDEHGQYREDPIPCPSLAEGKQGKAGGCRPTVRLQVIVPELMRLAYVLVLSTSWHDAMELTANLKAAENTTRMMGFDLRGVPFVLTRVPKEISTPPREPGGKRMRAKKWLLHLEAAPSWVALQIEAAQEMATPKLASGKTLTLPAPDAENGEDEGTTVDMETGEIFDPGFEDDDEDGQDEEPEAEAPSEPPKASTSANGNGKAPVPTKAGVAPGGKAARASITPERLKEIIEKKVAGYAQQWGNEELASQQQRGLIVSKLEEVWPGGEWATENRHAVLKFLTGNPSAKSLTKAQAAALLDWLVNPQDESGDYPLNKAACSEAQAIIRLLQVAAGQEELL